MALFIVSYRRDAEGVCCTNIAVAESRELVEAEYGPCDFIAVRQAKVHEVEALRQRGCPVVECPRERTAQERVDEALAAVMALVDNYDAQSCGCAHRPVVIYDELLKIADILGK